MHDFEISIVAGYLFEDTIDGYFSLHESLRQMMHRNNLTNATVSLSHAPMIDIPGLSANAAVPLNVTSCRAGLIDNMNLLLTHSGECVAGVGCWEWFDPAQNQPDNSIRFDPTIRLAEPAFVQGAGWFSTNIKNPDQPAAKAIDCSIALLRCAAPYPEIISDLPDGERYSPTSEPLTNINQAMNGLILAKSQG